MFTRKPLSIVLTLLSAIVLTGLWLAAPRRARAALSPAVSLAPEAPLRGAPSGAGDTRPFVALVRRLDRASGRGPHSASALVDLTMHLDLSEALVAGHAPSPAPIFITVTRTSGALRHSTLYPIPDGGTYLYVTALSSFWYWDFPQPGDRIAVRQGSRTLSMTVPALSASLLARRNLLVGTAPAFASLAAYLFPFDDPAAVYTTTATASAAGEYSMAWTAFPDLRPRDGGYLFLRRGNTSASVRFIAPFLRVQSGGYFLGMQLLPYGWGQLILPDGYGWDLYANGEGHTETDFQAYNSMGFLPSFKPGSTITAESGGSVVTTTIHTITAQVDRRRSLVFGQAPPGAVVRVQVFSGPLRETGSLWADDLLQEYTLTASASGQYSLSLPLSPGNYGLALVDNGDGHESFDWFAVPYFTVYLGWHGDARSTVLDGQVDGREPLTVSVYGAGGYPKAEYTLIASSSGMLQYYAKIGDIPSWRDNIALRLDGGDQVRVAQRGVSVLSATLPTLTLEVDPTGEFIYGLAPAGGRITLSGSTHWARSLERSVVVTASLTGTYRVRWDALGLGAGAFGLSAAWEAPGGYRLERQLFSQNVCPPWPSNIAVGGSRVVWWKYASPNSCSEVLTARLRRSDGTLKAEHTLWPTSGEVYFHTAANRPVPITGGDVVELEVFGAIRQIAVPRLEVHLDANNRRILGRSEPKTALHVLFSDERSFWTAELTTTASGAFTLTLPADVTPGPGAQAVASLSHNGTMFTAQDVIPWWQVNLSNGAENISGVLPPLTPYTLTMRRTYSDTAAVMPLGSGYASDNGKWTLSNPVSLEPGDVVSLTTPSTVYTLAVPSLSAFFDLSAARVGGTAPPEGELRVYITEVSPWRTYLLVPESTLPHADGHFSAVFPEIAGKTAVAGVLTYLPPSGGEVVLHFLPPRWEVTLGSHSLTGIAPYPETKVNFMWRSVAGETFSVTLPAVRGNGSFSVYLPEGLQPGDLLQMEAASQRISYTVPLVTAEHDFARQVLLGQAPPGARLEAGFGQASGGYLPRRVYVGAQGVYGVDTSDLRLKPNTGGYVLVTDKAGNTVRFYFRINGYRVWLPLIER